MDYLIRKVTLDGQDTHKLKCPKCGVWGYVDDDQLEGKVSILCDCGFHETITPKDSINDEDGRVYDRTMCSL